MRRVGDALVVCTNRHGGVSAPPYASLNLSRCTNDDPAAVRGNWKRTVEILRRNGVDPPAGPDGIACVYQVHGSDVHVVERNDLPGRGVEGDALVTTEVGMPVGILSADCAPVALVTAGAVAAVHVGWRGLAGGIIGSAVERLLSVGASKESADVRAFLGPCIHVDNYEFGDEALDGLVARFGPSVRGVTRDGRPALDLPAAVRSGLALEGVTDLDDVDICTWCSPDHFSHRRDAPTGRQAMFVTLLP